MLALGTVAAGILVFLAYSFEFVIQRDASNLMPVEFIGRAVSGIVIDGNGQWFNEGRPTELIIRSEREDFGWGRPKLCGSIRILGMGRNGEASEVRKSSRREGHTTRAQAAAPTRIVIENVEIHALGRIPLYLSPGVTEVRVENCQFTGRSSSTAIYLDAESARNVICGNRFTLETSREIIAVDGSAENRIEENLFAQSKFGGIYLYRNCGEGGTVRHQMPQGNRIIRNVFSAGQRASHAYAIWLGSRNGHRLYCHLDAGYPFGSSIDNRDFANHNMVLGNEFPPDSHRRIRDDGQDNQILP